MGPADDAVPPAQAEERYDQGESSLSLWVAESSKSPARTRRRPWRSTDVGVG